MGMVDEGGYREKPEAASLAPTVQLSGRDLAGNLPKVVSWSEG